MNPTQLAQLAGLGIRRPLVGVTKKSRCHRTPWLSGIMVIVDWKDGTKKWYLVPDINQVKFHQNILVPFPDRNFLLLHLERVSGCQEARITAKTWKNYKSKQTELTKTRFRYEMGWDLSESWIFYTDRRAWVREPRKSCLWQTFPQILLKNQGFSVLGLIFTDNRGFGWPWVPVLSKEMNKIPRQTLRFPNQRPRRRAQDPAARIV